MSRLDMVRYTRRMAERVNVTVTVAKVIRGLLEDPTGEHYGFALMDRSQLGSGTLYPVLARLEAAGWIESCREDIDPAVEKRPPRRYYRLTPDGLAYSRQALAELSAVVSGEWAPSRPVVAGGSA